MKALEELQQVHAQEIYNRDQKIIKLTNKLFICSKTLDDRANTTSEKASWVQSVDGLKKQYRQWTLGSLLKKGNYVSWVLW